MSQSILVVDHGAETGVQLRATLGPLGYVVDVAQGGRHGLERLGRRTYDMALVEMEAGEVDGLSLLDYALSHARARAVILMSRDVSVAQAVEAMRRGASDCLTKPLAADVLVQAMDKALGAPLEPGSLQAWRQAYAPEFIGEDARTLELMRLLQRISPSDCDVLITGASGTGKELMARCIHRASRRHAGPLVAINCAAIPKELMESEMFGHARGAFTGANERRRGKVEAACGGTLFLDEIGEMDLGLQGKFLRVIQEREVNPVGDNRTVKVDVRVVSATNQDLEEMARKKLFREDLLYRLNVVPLQLPRLQERVGDIEALAEAFIDRANRRHGRRVAGLGREALAVLRAYSWPGNIRELQNLIERLVVLKQNEGPIAADDLPERMRRAEPMAPTLGLVQLPEQGLDMCNFLARMEMQLTRDALKRANNCRKVAAELLGLKRTTLVQRLKKMNLEGQAV